MKYFACLLVVAMACGDDDAPMDADMPDVFDAGAPTDAGDDDDADMPDADMPDAPEVDAFDAGPMPEDIRTLAATLTHDPDLDITYPQFRCDGAGFRLIVDNAAIDGFPDRVVAAGWNLRTRETTDIITLDEVVTGWEATVTSAEVGFACDRDYEYSFIFLALRDELYASYPAAPDEFRGGVVTGVRDFYDDRIEFTATVDVEADGGYVYAWDLRTGEYDSYALGSEDEVDWSGTITYGPDGIQPENTAYVMVGGVVELEGLAIGSTAF